ncbi:hypothetical protein MWU77_12865 [Rhodococcus sp. F64268]|uniref:hypothetical protein n=1 Tax=Rhodococcus sp. F64268 TaxID=2926402 RepID=UPI001FF0F2AC|nr:hypothetical protein [Rhodococcus sp. F64268]MCK0091673.1 hypothetical protein [Rhodococcus sp. F64268]
MPAIDSAVSSEDPVIAGDRLAVTDTISFAPVPGWNVDSGFRVGQHGASDSVPQVALTRGNVTFSVKADKFDGTADELLSQIDATGVDAIGSNGNSVLALSSAPQPVTTDAGLSGVQVRFDTPSTAGSVTAFVADGTGLRVKVVGPPDQIADRGQEIQAMLAGMGTTERNGQ